MGIHASALLTNQATVAGVVCVVSFAALFKYFRTSNSKITITLPKLSPPPEFQSTDSDIVVIGGGITGASFAARLGMEGKKVVMIERNMGTDETMRGELLLPGGINALEEMDMKDILDDIDGNRVKGITFFDIRLGGEPGYVHYPKPGGITMRHGYLVNALRKTAIAQKSVTVIEAVGKELIKENGRVVGVRYKKKDDAVIQEIRAPLVVIGDGYYSKLTAEYRTTHQPVSSDVCIGFPLKNYRFKSGKGQGEFIEYGIGHPGAQIITYKLNDHEDRGFLFVHGKPPSNLKEFCEKIAPNLPEHMKKPVMESIADGLRVVRCQRMAANFDVTPGLLILGDALNTRHPVTGSGMTVALNDVLFWWKVFTNIHDLTNDEAIMQQKLIFRKERVKYSYVINVVAEINILLINDHDPSTVALQHQLLKLFREVAKAEGPQHTMEAATNTIGGLYGGTITDPNVMQSVLDSLLERTVKEIYKTRPYLSAVWESMQVRRKWKAMCSVMQLEAMS
ncbi:squalene monooxygenase-like [Amphiura filiformis]|uniref:squalene monooxygenase-like n=1 Tax=Amphiura filiformis TaxID=82378 RepID=UPI003B2131DC